MYQVLNVLVKLCENVYEFIHLRNTNTTPHEPKIGYERTCYVRLVHQLEIPDFKLCKIYTHAQHRTAL